MKGALKDKSLDQKENDKERIFFDQWLLCYERTAKPESGKSLGRAMINQQYSKPFHLIFGALLSVLTL